MEESTLVQRDLQEKRQKVHKAQVHKSTRHKRIISCVSSPFRYALRCARNDEVMDSCFRRNDNGQLTWDIARINGDSFEFKPGGRGQEIKPFGDGFGFEDG
jgi:hypothetical protein